MLLFWCVTLDVDFAQLVVVYALILPARIGGLEVAEDAQGLFVSAACSIKVALGKLAVGISVDDVE